MINKEKIIKIAEKKGFIKSREITNIFEVSRQYATKLITELVEEEKLVKIGSTKLAMYVTPEYINLHPEINRNEFKKTYTNEKLEEHRVLEDIEKKFEPYKKLPENIKSIFDYAFLEMLNNAIDHSQSNKINVHVILENDTLKFSIDDFGVGVFRNIMQKRNLKNEIEAIQDLVKGKMTTAPSLHSGEGIFFTSKSGDRFILDSFGFQFIADTIIDDIFVNQVKKQKRGTKVSFEININDQHHLNDIFKKYTNLTKDSDYGFDKTEIRVRLYTIGGVHISRSQARRVIDGLDKFKIVVMDYEQVPMVGQAFADEIYRVFQNKHPDIILENENMNEAVKFMVERAIQEAKVGRN